MKYVDETSCNVHIYVSCSVLTILCTNIVIICFKMLSLSGYSGGA